MLRELNQRGLAPTSTERFLESLRVMNEASHGIDVNPDAARRAVDIGTQLLIELGELRVSPEHTSNRGDDSDTSRP